ncbi:MAG: magnesium transporter CorA family protein [Lachnospiraceae bacterium]|jgi:magnesium transporter|nr:magnesium transporter CorA family protein [Lachnospiraceae bacterium]
MLILDGTTNKEYIEAIPQVLPTDGIFVLGTPDDIPRLSERFEWEEGAVRECRDRKETMRHTSYDGYDFTSLIHMDICDGVIIQRELALFLHQQYLVVILPIAADEHLESMVAELHRIASSADATKANPIARLYYYIFSRMTSDYSEMLEGLEDELEALAEAVMHDPKDGQLAEIGRLRATTYTVRKILRAFSYIGEEMLIDENELLIKKQVHYFRSIDSRLRKLYDFAASLYELSGEILTIHDSKQTIGMNETVNKLTVMTLFFGPLTVITGVYGMNFKFMPELYWPLGYPVALAVMLLCSLTVYLILKKKKWL